jgi:phosphatidylserine/phosphatidylglycerophosphate/cardiolipin synthase-like enzyme
LDGLHLLGDSVKFSNVLKFDYIMHHKFCIIDNAKVITGSYNWTIKARRYNKENVIYLEEKKIVDEFGIEFENLLKNSQPQSSFKKLQRLDEVSLIENIEIFTLEQAYNKEIERRILTMENLKIGVDTSLAFDLIAKHTPVIAAKQLATADNGHYIQRALEKLEAASRLDLCFEESVIRIEYAMLFDENTKLAARGKLTQLNFFKNPKYESLWPLYN